jgi:hypothetical protein
MTKKDLLEIVQSFIHSHQEDNLLLIATKESVNDLFNEYISPKKFEDYTLEELKLLKEKTERGINIPIIQHLKGAKEALLKKLERINSRIEDLS